MGGTFIDAKTGEEVPQCSMNKDVHDTEYHVSEITAKGFKRLIAVQVEKELPSDSKQQLVDKGGIQSSFLQGLQAADLRIPKYLRSVSLNEKYVQYCLDLLDFRAANPHSIVCCPTSASNTHVNVISLKKNVLFDNNLEACQRIRRNASDLGPFVIQIPSSTRYGHWIVGNIDSNQTAENILSGPLVHQLGAFNSFVSIARLGLDDVRGTKDTGSASFRSSVSISPPKSLETQTSFMGNLKCGSKSLNKDIVSIRVAKFADSDHSSASSSATFCQGTLQCKLDNGIPFYMFTVDGQREVYVAKVLKIESADHKGLDYVYSFYMRGGGRKEQGPCDTWLGDLVGRMNVSRSLRLFSNFESSTVMETEFVLFGIDAKQIGSTASSDPVLGKELHQNKAVHMFNPKHLLKHRSSLNFKARRSMPDEFPRDPCESNTTDNLGSSEFMGSSPNIELAAIIVKEEIYDNSQKTVVGGWGLKFLEKIRIERANTSQEASVSSDDSHENHHRAKSGRFARMDVILPAGIHGGPTTRNGGPSALTERWRSGGHCDCGGWDIGCPLTILNNQSSEEESTKTSYEGEKSLNLIIEGSKQSVPSLKMMNIRDNGDYLIKFQSSLSALQSFSIGMAMIHTRARSLISKNIQE